MEFNRRELCSTKHVGLPCIFMKKDKGCSFIDGYCRPIIPACKGKLNTCSHIIVINSIEYCNAYMNPEIPWTHYKECPLATHMEKIAVKKLVVLDPRKAAKQRRKQGNK